VLLTSQRPAAQQSTLVQAVVDLTDAIEGVFGDEGAMIGPALDRMAQALSGRDAPAEVLRDALGDMPLLPLAAYREGYARLARSEFESGIEALRSAASSDPLVNDPATTSGALLSAVTALRQGRLTEARALLEQSDVQRDYWAASEHDKAVEQLEASIRMNPTSERSRLALSRVLSSANRDDAAERALLDTIDVIPESARAHWWLAMAYERANRFDDARREYEKAAAGAVAGRSHLYGAVGRLASGAADLAGAVDAFERAVTASPRDPGWRKLLAGALLHQDRPDRAAAELRAALLLNPRDGDAHRLIGQIHLDAGRAAEAADALRQAMALQPDDVDAQYALATALTRLGNSEEGARYFERVEQIQRQRLADQRRALSLDVLKEEAALRATESDFDRAAALWRQVIQLEPARAANHLGLAAALANAGRHDAAIEEYERGAALGAEPVVFRLLADLYARVGRASDAARARVRYEAALQRDGAPAR
jgi:tetratricopeptide (TPR) repeat protein